jgi:hypothetical protein
MKAVSGASVFALLNRSEALAVSAHMSLSTVVDAGVGVLSGTNIGDVVAVSALHSDALHKEERGGCPQDQATGMQSMCCSTVAKTGAMSGWYRMRRKAALMSSL